jgi:hypothetical protein
LGLADLSDFMSDLDFELGDHPSRVHSREELATALVSPAGHSQSFDNANVSSLNGDIDMLLHVSESESPSDNASDSEDAATFLALDEDGKAQEDLRKAERLAAQQRYHSQLERAQVLLSRRPASVINPFTIRVPPSALEKKRPYQWQPLTTQEKLSDPEPPLVHKDLPGRTPASSLDLSPPAMGEETNSILTKTKEHDAGRQISGNTEHTFVQHWLQANHFGAHVQLMLAGSSRMELLQLTKDAAKSTLGAKDGLRMHNRLSRVRAQWLQELQSI